MTKLQKKDGGKLDLQIEMFHQNSKWMAEIVDKAKKDAKGQPIFTGDEHMGERLAERANLLKAMQETRDAITTKHTVLTTTQTASAEQLITLAQDAAQGETGQREEDGPHTDRCPQGRGGTESQACHDQGQQVQPCQPAEDAWLSSGRRFIPVQGSRLNSC